MKMKIPTTDQLLLDLASMFFGVTSNVIDFLLSNKYQQINILVGNENPIFKKYRDDKNRKKFDQLMYQLKKTDCIRVKVIENKKEIIITKKGLSKVLKASFRNQEYDNREDGKWIMVIFDIPQRHPKARNLFKSILKNLGYKLFQQSVWVTPYDVLEKTERLFKIHSLEVYAKIFIVEKL